MGCLNDLKWAINGVIISRVVQFGRIGGLSGTIEPQNCHIACATMWWIPGVIMTFLKNANQHSCICAFVHVLLPSGTHEHMKKC